ncbi:MAG: pilus assembly protein [Betaproteobacteria bacterium]|nr:pilus assembly protein [Betaproteobacteria bacterium]
MTHLRARIKALAIHFSISLAVALLAAVVVFFVWYPYPYRELSGGRELFLILVTVDVILGPLLTFVVYRPDKSRRALLFDFSVIGLTQVAALVYGLHTVFVARPVHLVFEIDRFRVVHAIEVPAELVPKTPAGIDALPVTGPTTLAVRPVTGEERADVVMAELAGLPIGTRPDFWRPYPEALDAVRRESKPLADLRRRFPNEAALLDRHVTASGRPPERLAYLPLVGRKEFWTALVDTQDGSIVAAIPLDSY